MNNVVSLADWKKRKADEEITRLAAELNDLIGDLDIVPEPYYAAVDTIGFDSLLDGIQYAQLEPTVESCRTELGFMSQVLRSLGKSSASDDLDKIVEELKTKE